jgi:hypothetical protein
MARDSRHLRQTGMVAHTRPARHAGEWWWAGGGGGRQRSARCPRKQRTTASPLSWSKVRSTFNTRSSSPPCSSPPTRNVTAVLVLWPAATTPAARPIANRCPRLATPPAGHTAPGTLSRPCSGAGAALCTCECLCARASERVWEPGAARRYGFGARTPTGERARVGDACKLEMHAPGLMRKMFFGGIFLWCSAVRGGGGRTRGRMKGEGGGWFWEDRRGATSIHCLGQHFPQHTRPHRP